MREVRFNINDYVRVQLTDKGRQLHRERHERLFGEHFAQLPYIPPKEDADGWSRWQLWALMEELGGHCHIGMSEQPFGTLFIFEVPDE